MAKPRRSRSSVPPKKSKAKAPARPATKRPGRSAGPARRSAPAGRPRQAPAAKPGRKKRASSASSTVPQAPSPRDLAVEVFERGFAALQQRKFAAAAQLFRSVLKEYPDEKELQERSRVYLAICERQADAKLPHAPLTWEERTNAATVALNRGEFATGIALLGALEREDGNDDLVQYLLAIAHAGLGDSRQALSHLGLAIELNWDNRRRASEDADLDPLRDDPAFVSLLAAAPAPRRRSATRSRHGR